MIKNEVDDLDMYWNELLYNVTGGNASEMIALKRYDIIDFFNYVDNKIRDGRH